MLAKNLILTGVKSVTLYDESPATLYDLSAQYYLSESDIGKPRAQCCINKLAELNNYVTVKVQTGDLTEEVLRKFQVIVICDQSWEVQQRINDFCHANGIRFIAAATRGVFASVFCDFGSEFVVVDPTGEPPASVIVAGITQDNPALITIVDDQRLPFDEGDVVAFSEVQGMTELNGRQFKVKPKGPYTFEIDVDSSSFGAYKTGGYVAQVKQPILHKFVCILIFFLKIEN